MSNSVVLFKEKRGREQVVSKPKADRLLFCDKKGVDTLVKEVKW